MFAITDEITAVYKSMHLLNGNVKMFVFQYVPVPFVYNDVAL